MPKAHKLVGLTVEEVSAVDKPANARKFLIRKRVEDVMPDEEKPDAKAEADKKPDAKAEKQETPPDAVLKAAQDKATAEEAARKAAEEKAAALEAEVAKLKAGGQSAEDLAKAEKAALEKRLADMEALAKAERDARILREKTDHLQKFAHLPIDVRKDAVLFKSLDEKLTPDELKRVDEILTAADALAGDAFQARGSTQAPDADSAEAQIQAKAAALVAKDANLTKQAAIEKVAASEPDLYRQYQAEQRAAGYQEQRRGRRPH